MTFFPKVFDISKTHNSSTEEGSRSKILCNEHHPLDKGHFTATIRAFSNSIKLAMRGNPGPKETVPILQNEDAPHDVTVEEIEFQPICVAFSWFILGLAMACLLLCITLTLSSRSSSESEDYKAGTVPSSNVNDEEKQLLFSDMA
ncbi:hypothetical protein SKDZ_15G3310 [Saccharomyces kudriavzevii ZP591]|nr:hypothetical protein SKDZ_15G3310 [Saccharomyces kudriavzevii ZP591]